MTLKKLATAFYKSYKKGIKEAFSPKNLFYTNVLISMGLSVTGDLLEQSYGLYRGRNEKLDYERTIQMGLSGFTPGIICHHWYIFLDKIIKGRTLDQALKKLFLDQCIFSPLVILSFFATVAVFEEHPLENFTEEVRHKFWLLYKAEWVVWPVAQMINFYFLPTQYRVVYDNIISLGHDVYASHIKHNIRVPKDKDNEVKK